MRLPVLLIAVILGLNLSSRAQAQTLSFFGQVLSNDNAAAAGIKAYLFGEVTAKWFGPAISDSYGRFSLFGLPPGKYLLRVYVTGNKMPAFQQEVSVPGKITIHLSSAKLVPLGD